MGNKVDLVGGCLVKGSFRVVRSVVRLKGHCFGRLLHWCGPVVCWVSAMQYNKIQFKTIQYNKVQYNKIQYNTIQYNTIQYKLSKRHPANKWLTLAM